ncbi:FHA domain-containing protein [Curtobacterium sp. AG1037]|uniref:FHA domain-containing protein n=1 Tax=Curtobacterium sp. AG1037 TaxID=2183990 RepID=UPI000E0BFA01|nr:FHA domain-containing protein [Curtobacterium sp. AG1037]RDH95050.1 FHA domain-containing protein [Curtobacterium sp. AG1037]
MIHVTINPDGTGTVGLPGRAVPVEAASLRAARERAIRVLTEHAASSSMSLDVIALDAGETVMLTVYVDGRVTVNNSVDNGMYRNSTGDLMPLTPEVAARFKDTDTESSTVAAGPPTAVPADTTTAVPQPTAPASGEAPPTLDLAPHGDDSEPESVAEVTHELEATIVRTSTPADRPKAELSFTTGQVAKVTGTALIGRHPRIGENEKVDQVVIIDDESRSLSRTHCLVSWQDDVFWILDRNSGNGTSVERDGETVSLSPSTAHILKDGDKVLIGDHSFTVALTGAVTARV